MFEEIFHSCVTVLIHIIEIIGIFIIVSGVFKAFKEYLKNFFGGSSSFGLRHDLGTAMVTGLEFKMAAEILRTVIVRTKEEIVMLGAIIVLREILFFFINKDIKEHNSSHTKESHSNKLTAIKFERD